MVRFLPLLLVSLSLPVCGGEALPLELVRVIEVDGRQGVAVDGDRYYVSGSTALYIYDKGGELLLSNEEPFAKLEKEANHIGDISVHEGEVFAGVEKFLDGRGSNIQVAVYDAYTLDYRRSIDWNPESGIRNPESGQVEVSAVADGKSGGIPQRSG